MQILGIELGSPDLYCKWPYLLSHHLPGPQLEMLLKIFDEFKHDCLEKEGNLERKPHLRT